MNNLKFRILIFSCVILVGAVVITEFKSHDALYLVVIYGLIELIQIAYSVFPLIKEHLKNINSSKNLLSSSTFTDRRNDIEDILKKLVIKEHIFEIKGNDKQCGKTSLAKKVVDCINSPKELINYGINIKCPYHKAYYIDMNEYSENELNNFFQEEFINNKVVLIFDNVKSLDILIDKQSIYHFQLVYILDDANDINFFSHTVTEFDYTYINELQHKIKHTYQGISSINQEEINVLFKLTNGNIGKIYGLLCEQQCINWIKNIANNKQTDYDEELNKIQVSLFIGEYENARKKLDEFKEKYNRMFEKNNDLQFKYILMFSDCEHLLNNYETAIDIISILKADQYKYYNLNYEVELHEMHYYKHLWKCNEALLIFQDLKHKSYAVKADALGILVAKYFINDLYVPMTDNDSLTEFINIYKTVKSTTFSETNDVYKIQRYEVIYDFYTKHPQTSDFLIESINKVIDKYVAENNRLRINAFFIKAEIYRLYHQYDLAFKGYKRCLKETTDKNIIIQTQLMAYYLIKCKHIETDFTLLKDDELICMCENNEYSKKVYQKINCIILNDPIAESIENCFDSRIMIIL